LGDEICAEHRNQKTVRPATIGEPCLDYLTYLNAKEVADKPAKNEYSDARVQPELSPQMLLSRSV
jgi:hypothetical protein